MINPDDFGFSPEEIKNLVTGAQQYLPPEPDPADEQKLTTVVEETQP